jgi:trehalose-6-phosphatase
VQCDGAPFVLDPTTHGRNIIEVKSAATTKAQALRELIDEVEPQILIMCGDDLGDVPASMILRPSSQCRSRSVAISRTLGTAVARA